VEALVWRAPLRPRLPTGLSSTGSVSLIDPVKFSLMDRELAFLGEQPNGPGEGGPQSRFFRVVPKALRRLDRVGEAL
jgi:hypothetical protein